MPIRRGRLAEQYGYPVLLKAAAGGGRREGDARRSETPDELPSSFESAQREAKNAFGDDAVYLEKYVEGPRHVEIQVLADSHGHVIHLGERECSVQRRHQKMIDEAPSVAVSPALRREMGETAVRAAKAAGYVNAGTCEFLLDKDGKFYFLEMNTRLQVEHPVTELVMGIDLVQWQLRIAAGERLTVTQDAVTPTGWAIECRITSEDPANGFTPVYGDRRVSCAFPRGPGVRWDGGDRSRHAKRRIALRSDARQAHRLCPDTGAGDRPNASGVARVNSLGDRRRHAASHLRVMEDAEFRRGVRSRFQWLEHGGYRRSDPPCSRPVEEGTQSWPRWRRRCWLMKHRAHRGRVSRSGRITDERLQVSDASEWPSEQRERKGYDKWSVRRLPD